MAGFMSLIGRPKQTTTNTQTTTDCALVRRLRPRHRDFLLDEFPPTGTLWGSGGQRSDLCLGPVRGDGLEGVPDARGLSSTEVTEHLVVPVGTPPPATRPQLCVSLACLQFNNVFFNTFWHVVSSARYKN